MFTTAHTCSRTLGSAHQLSTGVLRLENHAYAGSGGVSQANRSSGFVPAFLDAITGEAYRSRFADGSPAPFHLLEGLPASVLVGSGDTIRAREGLVSGFLRDGEFYTRDQAAKAVQRCDA
jgi:hypothetical protein